MHCVNTVAHVPEGDTVRCGHVRVVLLFLEGRQPVLLYLLPLGLALPVILLVIIMALRQETTDICVERKRCTVEWIIMLTTEMGERVGPRLRELAPTAGGSQEAGLT